MVSATRPLPAVAVVALLASLVGTARGVSAGDFREGWAREARSPSLVVVSSPRGVVARRVDGGFSRVLVEGAVRGAGFDARGDLLWWVKEDRLMVMDLRAAAPKPVAIATGLPDIHVYIAGEGRDAEAINIWSKSDDPGQTLHVVWGSSGARIRADASFAFGEDGEDRGRAEGNLLARLAIGGKPWLDGHKRRKLAPLETLPLSSRPNMSVPEELADCDQSEHCGESTPFGRTGYVLVVTQFSCGETCSKRCLLLDPKTRLWSSAPWPMAWSPPAYSLPVHDCGPYAFSPDGLAIVHDGQVCAGPAPCQNLDGPALGWLSGTTVVGQASQLEKAREGR